MAELRTRARTVAAELQLVHNLHRRWAENPSAGFEDTAEEFHRETGYMAPGKDVPVGGNPSEGYMLDRQRSWKAWNDRKLKERLDRQARALEWFNELE